MRNSWRVWSLWVAISSACTPRNVVQVNEVAQPVETPAPAPNVQVTEIMGLAAPPASVTKVFTVVQRGKPITTLRANAFRIAEDGQALDNKAIDLRLVPPEEVIAFHTVLLMDLGPAATKEGRTLLTQAAMRFVQELRPRQSVTVLAFDGSTYIRVVGDFPRVARGDKTFISEGRFASLADSSRNLRGAVLEGLSRLDARLKQQVRPIRVGSLVVFSIGPDLANRAAEATMDERLKQTSNHLYFVGIQSNTNIEGKGPAKDDVTQVLARNGKVLSADLSHLPEAFGDVTSLVAADMNSHYVLSYCSPARAGKRNMRVEVDVVNDELKVETGTLESQFSAAGFSAGCDATRPPRLSLLKATAKN